MLPSTNSTIQIITTVFGGVGLLIVGYFVPIYIAPRAIDYLSYFEEGYAESSPFSLCTGFGVFFAVLAVPPGYSPSMSRFVWSAHS
jgi:hypothetical protein